MAKTLVLYYSVTNTTKRIAEQVAQKLDADIVEIHAVQPYTAADLDWHDPSSRTSIEQHQHNSRVAVKDDLPDITAYDNIVIGHPTLLNGQSKKITMTLRFNQGTVLNNAGQIDSWIACLNFA